MIIGSSAIQQFVSKAVTNTRYDPTQQDAYTQAINGAASQLAAITGSDDSSAQSSTGDTQTYDESFAKMMVNLKAAMANSAASVSDDDKAAAAFAASGDKQIAASDSVSKTVSDSLAASGDTTPTSDSTSSASAQFLAYMNQTDAEKARLQLTGVSKEEYDAMSPQEQASVDKRVADLQRQKTDQQVAEQDIKTRIALAKAELA